MMSFHDRILIRLLDDAFVAALLTDAGLERLFAISRELAGGELEELEVDGLKRRQFEMPVFETLRTTSTDERLLPGSERWKRDREQPRRGRLSWTDSFIEVRLKAKIDPRRAPLKEIQARDLLDELGGPTSLDALRAALTARYGATVVEAAFAALRITSFEEFRRRGARFLKFVSEPVPPFDPDDPANARSYTLPVCVLAEEQLVLADTLRRAKLARSVLENERQHRELFEDGEIKRPYVFVVLFPRDAARPDMVPGLDAEQLRARTRALFAAEEMAAHFVAD